MTDPTEPLRRILVAEINSHPEERQALETVYGRVWNTEELARDFEVLGFAAPFVVVRRKSDRLTGSLCFQHQPRLYYDFRADG